MNFHTDHALSNTTDHTYILQCQNKKASLWIQLPPPTPHRTSPPPTAPSHRTPRTPNQRRRKETYLPIPKRTSSFPSFMYSPDDVDEVSGGGWAAARWLGRVGGENAQGFLNCKKRERRNNFGKPAVCSVGGACQGRVGVSAEPGRAPILAIAIKHQCKKRNVKTPYQHHLNVFRILSLSLSLIPFRSSCSLPSAPRPGFFQ